MSPKLLLAPLAFALIACQSDAPPPAADAAKTPVVMAPAPAVAPADPAAAWAAKVDAVLASAHRSETNKARDAHRHPKETLMFFGLKPEMTVIEITPGAGWYTEVLAPLLKDQGKLKVALIDPATASSDRAKEFFTNANQGFSDKLKADQGTFGGSETMTFASKEPVLGAAGSADMVVTFRNVHNWNENQPAMFKAFFEVLKPGGVLGVEDHRANPGSDAEAAGKKGYILEDTVIKLATDAGFELAEKSEVNANPNDTKDYENGVWSLPPTLTNGEVDRDKYVAIGESDRMTLRFVKPAQ